MSLHFLKSQKGFDMLLHDGYLFRKNKQCKNKIAWECVEYKNSRCPARVHTENNRIIRSTGEHNHVQNKAAVVSKAVVNDIKEKSIKSLEKSRSVIAECTAGMSLAVLAQLPKTESLQRSIRRRRYANQGHLHNPKSLVDLVIPEEFKFILNSQSVQEPFLLYDSGPGEDRILVFSTQRNLQLLSRCIHWYASGTFRTSPPLFGQLYTIHGIINSYNVIPAVFALLPNKTENTYTHLLQQLKFLELFLNPVSITTDFEAAAVNAFQTEFPDIISRGCLFHLVQCVERKIKEDGLIDRYKNDANFALHIRMLPALALVPMQDVVAVFNELVQSDYFVAQNEELHELISYFEKTWIGRSNSRIDPLFPIVQWNVFFDGTVENLPGPNSAVEGWHKRFNKSVGAHHSSNIWRFIGVLKKEQQLNDKSIEDFIQGKDSPPPKKGYQQINARLKNVVNSYGLISNIEYLRNAAQNLTLDV